MVELRIFWADTACEQLKLQIVDWQGAVLEFDLPHAEVATVKRFVEHRLDEIGMMLREKYGTPGDPPAKH